MQLYPNARLLLATKEDFTRDRRKLLTAKMASGVWDGIMTTHSSFERIGMSRAFRSAFCGSKSPRTTSSCATVQPSRRRARTATSSKRLEKQKARREARLKDLLAEEKKDDGLVFDGLGVDHVCIDESQYFKNFKTPTKMERVAASRPGAVNAPSTCT